MNYEFKAIWHGFAPQVTVVCVGTATSHHDYQEYHRIYTAEILIDNAQYATGEQRANVHSSLRNKINLQRKED